MNDHDDLSRRITRGFYQNGQPVSVPPTDQAPEPLPSASNSSSSSDLGSWLGPTSFSSVRGHGDSHSARPLAKSASRGSGSITELERMPFVFHMVLHHLCSFYESAPERREQLSQELCHRLAIPLRTPVLYEFPELSALRSHYQHIFVRLVKSAQRSLTQRLADPPAARWSNVPKSRSIQCINEIREQDLYQNSRYRHEFEELGFIAKGGFGLVFRARNKLDGCLYAVKKIMLKYCDPDLFAKIFREVTTLAQLNHPNVVSYKTAWLEPLLDSPTDLRRDRSSHSMQNMAAEVWSVYSQPCSSPTSPAGDEDEERILRHLEAISQSSGIVFDDGQGIEDQATRRVNDTQRAFQHSEFELKSASGVDLDFYPPPKKTMPMNVTSIQELDELDSVEENLPHVIGMAATPPNRTKFPPIDEIHEHEPSLLGGTSPSSKFWIASDDEEDRTSSRGGRLKPREESPLKAPLKSKHPISRELLTSSHCLKAFGNEYNPQKGFQHDRAMLYLQMQLCDRTLRDWLDVRNAAACDSGQSSYSLDVSLNLHIFEQILHGVAYIHSQGIIHRDLKPRNIFLSRNNEVQIGDFGLAKQDLSANVSTPHTPNDPLEPQHQLFHASEKSHTSGVGTQAYGAPEQLQFGVVNDKSDIYSLGIILFELFHPFGTAMERSKAITLIREGNIPLAFLEAYPRMSKKIQSVLSKVPSLRPSASDLLETLFSDEAKEKQKLEDRVKYLSDLVDRQREELQAKNDVIRSLKQASLQ
eukprot:maker-scaffold186_size273091-snap-gene-1.31 protein:Tk00907 transcript:maker-scaffold186_size273091-snap-gene-1.31-mRNA-1 annotation:"eukaryotic translation initiation factor 2-alpha kinase 1"